MTSTQILALEATDLGRPRSPVCDRISPPRFLHRPFVGLQFIGLVHALHPGWAEERHPSEPERRVSLQLEVRVVLEEL